VWCEPSNDARTVATCFASFGVARARPANPAGVVWSAADAIESATAMLRRHSAAGPAAGRDGLLVIARAPETVCASGQNCDPAAECSAARAAADLAVGRGVDLSVACVGAGCGASCLAQLPVPGSFYAPGAWPAAIERQARLARASSLSVTEIRLTDVAPAGIEPDPGTFDPPSAAYDAASRTVSWSEVLLPGSGEASFAYAAVATRPGRTKVSFGDGRLVDSSGREGAFTVPDREVAVARSLSTLIFPRLFSHEARVHP
jgi:hypothetical protein